eukprot:COSAG05_NODE_17426_length_325_cov_0.911504_1_plen_104_part_10
MLGPQNRSGSGSGEESLEGLAAVATWSKSGQLRSALLQKGSWLALPQYGGLTIAASSSATISLKLTSPNQYRLLCHGSGVTVELTLPWSGEAKEVNVWDSGHAY